MLFPLSSPFPPTFTVFSPHDSLWRWETATMLRFWFLGGLRVQIEMTGTRIREACEMLEFGGDVRNG